MEDREIVEAFLKRDEDAVRHASEKYGRYCLAVAGRVLSREEDAEECVNDALLAAWNSIPPQKPERLSTYLGKLTRRIAVSRLRAETAGKRGGTEAVLSLEELEESIPDGEDFTEALEAEELAGFISAFLRRLPQEERVLFLRRYWYFDSIREIADAAGYRESKVKMKLKRTRDKLALALRQEGYLQ